MEGGIKWYHVTRLDYESGFDDSLMDSILVYLMLIEKRDILPLGMAHDSCTLYLSFGVSLFCLCVEGWPWRRPPYCEVCPHEFISLHIGLVYNLIRWHTPHPHLHFFLQVPKEMEEQRGYNTVGYKRAFVAMVSLLIKLMLVTFHPCGKRYV